MGYDEKVFILCLTSFLTLQIVTAAISFKCRDEGRYALESDCNSYIDCVRRNETGLLEARKRSCGKGGFHPKEKRCVDLKKLKGCSHRRARLDLKRHDLSHFCSSGSDFVCSDCNTLIHCLDGIAYAQSCAPGDFCQVRESFGGAVCYPEQIPQCSCEDFNVFKRDAYDDRTFYFCDDLAFPTFYKCSEEMVFDLNIEQCVNEYGLPPCSKIGVFADADDCRNYYTCIQSERGWVQKLFTCPGMTMYSEVNSKCEDPCNWYKGVFKCTEEGRFRDKTNCQAFYECIFTDGGFRETKRFCPSGFYWEQAGSTNSGNCIKKEDSTCHALTPTTCDIPPDWCEFSVDSESQLPDLDESVDDYPFLDYGEPNNSSIKNTKSSVRDVVNEGGNILQALEEFYSQGLNTDFKISLNRQAIKSPEILTKLKYNQIRDNPQPHSIKYLTDTSNKQTRLETNKDVRIQIPPTFVYQLLKANKNNDFSNLQLLSNKKREPQPSYINKIKETKPLNMNQHINMESILLVKDKMGNIKAGETTHQNPTQNLGQEQLFNYLSTVSTVGDEAAVPQGNLDNEVPITTETINFKVSQNVKNDNSLEKETIYTDGDNETLLLNFEYNESDVRLPEVTSQESDTDKSQGTAIIIKRKDHTYENDKPNESDFTTIIVPNILLANEESVNQDIFNTDSNENNVAMALALTSAKLGENADSKIFDYIDLEKLSEANLSETFNSDDSTVTLVTDSNLSQGSDNDDSPPSPTSEMSLIDQTDEQMNPSSSTSFATSTTLIPYSDEAVTATSSPDNSHLLNDTTTESVNSSSNSDQNGESEGVPLNTFKSFRSLEEDPGFNYLNFGEEVPNLNRLFF